MAFVHVLAQLWSEWGFRVSVLSSLVANVILSLLSFTRRRSASGWRAVALWAAARILWLAYQSAEMAGPGALSSLSLSASNATAEEQHVIAFWAPFLLLHLGGPDTMTAYALEDNAMSVRKFAEMFSHVLGALYAQYKYIYRVRRGTLLTSASVLMFLVGATRYVERWYALWQSKSMMEDDGDKDNSNKKKKKKNKKKKKKKNKKKKKEEEEDDEDKDEEEEDDDDGDEEDEDEEDDDDADDDEVEEEEDDDDDDDGNNGGDDYGDNGSYNYRYYGSNSDGGGGGSHCYSYGDGDVAGDDDRSGEGGYNFCYYGDVGSYGSGCGYGVSGGGCGGGGYGGGGDNVDDCGVGIGYGVGGGGGGNVDDCGVGIGDGGGGGDGGGDDDGGDDEDSGGGSGEEELVDLDDDGALRLAQDLFHVCRRALVDSSVLPHSEKQRASEKIFQLEWKSMCRVAEMELSLMYEALYTKAIVLHTCPLVGYAIRLASPVATASAAALYIYSRRFVRGYDDITYLLLGFALAMDLMWLLRALGSTWTYAALKEARPPWACWLRHHLLCRGRWHCLHLLVEYPVRWLFCCGHPGDSHRTWSGTIGRYNLLHQCSAAAAHHRRCGPWWRQFCSWLEKKFMLEERPYLSQLPLDVKRLLIERVRVVLASTHKRKPAAASAAEHHDVYAMADIRTCWGHQALKNLKGAKQLFPPPRSKVKREEEDEDAGLPKFGKEFEEDVLVWHMAICVFLSRVMGVTIPASSTSTSHATKKKAIEAMSECLMFFVAVRRHMLPGLVLHSLFDMTLDALGKIWDEKTTGSSSSSTAANCTCPTPEDKLADMLLKKATGHEKWFLGGDGSRLVFDAAVLAGQLIGTRKGLRQQQKRRMLVLEFVFNVWVDKLLYAAVRCSRESHASQLSRGGDLTTLLWIIVQHAGLFRIGERRPGYKPKPPQKKKKVVAKIAVVKKAAPYEEDDDDEGGDGDEEYEDSDDEDEESDEEYDDMPTGYITLY